MNPLSGLKIKRNNGGKLYGFKNILLKGRFDSMLISMDNISFSCG
jgi:hypothetical protein